MVPNLNVFYEEVELVYWDNTQCIPDKVPDPNDSTNSTLIFPSTFIFNVKSSESKEALTFYSRHHIKKVKIQELSDSVSAQNTVLLQVKNREIICCEPEENTDGLTQYKGSCLGTTNPMVACNQGDEDYEQERTQTLETSLNSWQQTLLDADQTKTDAIGNNKAIQGWFNDADVGQKGMADEKLNVGDMSLNLEAQLASPFLVDDAKLLPEGYTLLGVESEDDGREKIRETKRLQFSGASGAYELSLDKAVASTYSMQDCNQNIPLISAGATGGAVVGGGAAFGATVGYGLATSGFFATSAAATAGATATGAAIGAGAVAGPALALAAGALVISSAVAGCNYELDVGLDVGDISLQFATFGIGASSTLSGGKYFRLFSHNKQHDISKLKFSCHTRVSHTR